MPHTQAEVRPGVYYDSIVLMQLQATLSKLPQIGNVGVMMGTEVNKEILAQSNLLPDAAHAAQTDDLIIALTGETEDAVQTALGQVDSLLAKRAKAGDATGYLPKSLGAATKIAPDASWVLVSVPGRYAAGVAREALSLGKNVFLYSDNVSLEDEVSLKQRASAKNLLLMGPDCGTAIINGVGLDFANHVRPGPIGVVAASGTGLQYVTARIHQLGSGITHALGTGGRDLSEEVGAIAAHQSLDLLGRDPETSIIVLISKPPSPQVAEALLQTVRATGKPIVVNFIGYIPTQSKVLRDNLRFAASLEETARLAIESVNLLDINMGQQAEAIKHREATQQRYLRGLFSGGTLAYEALLLLQQYLPPIYSNIPLKKEYVLPNPLTSQQHTIVDLGEDELTVGRLHPMLDQTLRLERLAQEARDPTVALILLDVVLGHGSHPDPASELAPAVAQAVAQARDDGRSLEVVTLIVGTDQDPQDMDAQIAQLEAAGVRVETDSRAAISYVGQTLQRLNLASELPSVALDVLTNPLSAINVGLSSFTESLMAQDASVLHVDWRPPASGNEKLMSILERMKNKNDAHLSKT